MRKWEGFQDGEEQQEEGEKKTTPQRWVFNLSFYHVWVVAQQFPTKLWNLRKNNVFAYSVNAPFVQNIEITFSLVCPPPPPLSPSQCSSSIGQMVYSIVSVKTLQNQIKLIYSKQIPQFWVISNIQVNEMKMKINELVVFLYHNISLHRIGFHKHSMFTVVFQRAAHGQRMFINLFLLLKYSSFSLESVK